MRFVIPEYNLSPNKSGGDSIEDENGRAVGQFLFRTSSLNPEINRTVILFGKYRGQFRTHAESQAFADGVAAVLEHMTKVEFVEGYGPRG